MGYKNALTVFPDDLLKAIQKHIDGEYIYIPRKPENKKHWGELKNNKQYIQERNQRIFSQYQSGTSVDKIATQYFLSPKTIYKIISDMKKKF